MNKPSVWLNLFFNDRASLLLLANHLENGWPIPHIGDTWQMNAQSYKVTDVKFDYYLSQIIITTRAQDAITRDSEQR